jgi:hypothetical protein
MRFHATNYDLSHPDGVALSVSFDSLAAEA